MLKSLSHLHAYYWIARLGSFHAAAARLGLTQPTVTARIRELERSLGTQLFVRSSRGVQLTPEGAGMFDYVDRILEMVEDLEGRIEKRRPLKGVLKFGAPDNFAIICLSEFLKAMSREHPEFNLAVMIDTSRVLTDAVADGRLDLAIFSRPLPGAPVRLESLGFQRVIWAAHPMLGLADRQVHPRDLLAFPIFTSPAPSHLFSILMDWFDACGVKAPRLSSCNSISTIASMVSAGAGISVLPQCLINLKSGPPNIQPISVSPPVPDQELFLGLPKGSVNRAIPEIVRIIRSVVASTNYLDGSGQIASRTGKSPRQSATAATRR
jgi:DNA-binding transcriptional LysR family regulator